jgi:SAM-dependent methyltransferase
MLIDDQRALCEQDAEVAWEEFPKRLRRCTPPQVPPSGMGQLVERLIGRGSGATLLLGVTSELSAVSTSVVAIDWSASAIAFTWPGDADGRRAIRGDWRRLPFALSSFASVVGDGCLNCLEYPGEYRLLLDELARVTRPGGRMALRVFVTPADADSLWTTRTAALAGAVDSVSGLKWRLAASLRAEGAGANVPVRAIHEAFDDLFPDRRALARATGWRSDDIDTVDALRHVSGTYSFPTIEELLDVVPVTLVPSFSSSGCYELAERCPMLVLDVRAA